MASCNIVTVAAVISGPDASQFRPQVENAIEDMEMAHGMLLRERDGDVESTRPLDRQMKKLVLGEYGN